MSDKCFACDRALGQSPSLVQVAQDDQLVRVGSECYEKVIAAGFDGYQPPAGGPLLFEIGIQWNKGAFNDGYAARYVYDAGLDQCPRADTYGRFFTQSWRAGWHAADAERAEPLPRVSGEGE